MDVVYLVKQTGYNEELRFSLRSLENLEFDRVFIVGFKPFWVMNVKRVKFEDSAKRKGENTAKKLLEIANNNDISEDFILMADDIYILKKNEKIGYYKIGSLKSFLGAAKNRNSLHYKSIKAVYDLYSEGDCFEIHTPIVLNKTKLRKLFERYSPLEIIAKRSLYCIENGITGELREDYKFYNKGSLKIGKGQEYLSSLDFKSEKLKNFLFKKFPNKSNFEFIDIF